MYLRDFEESTCIEGSCDGKEEKSINFIPETIRSMTKAFIIDYAMFMQNNNNVEYIKYIQHVSILYQITINMDKFGYKLRA